MSRRRCGDRVPQRVDDDVAVDEAFDAALAAEAVAAEPDPPVPDDAVPLTVDDPSGGVALLPAWYMPPARATARGGWRAVIGGVLIGALVIVSAVGLCVTDGLLEIAW